MIGQEYTDHFEIVNGPEDGTEFPVTRTPVDIGHDPGCGVHVQLDSKVKLIHARVTVVSDGYRVRRLANAPVYVNGKRAGVVLARVVRTGGVVQVGETQLALQCSPDGLASRSHGMPSESNLGWALRIFYRKLMLGVRIVWRTLRSLLGRFFWFAVLAAIVLGLVAYFRPWYFQRIVWYGQHWFNIARWRIMEFIN